MRCGIGDLGFGDPVCSKCRKLYNLNVQLIGPGGEPSILICKLCEDNTACLPVAAWKDPAKKRQNRGLLKRGQQICDGCADLLEVEVYEPKPGFNPCVVCLKERACSTVAQNYVARPAWDDYFMQIAKVAGSRSTCLRRNTGAVLVRDKQMLSTGYNGAPKGATHCLDAGCLRAEKGIPSGKSLELCRGAHAEENAIAQAARHGVSTDGAMIYCTNYPCAGCVKLLINAGIRHVVCVEDYNDELAKAIVKEVGPENLTVECWQQQMESLPQIDVPITSKVVGGGKSVRRHCCVYCNKPAAKQVLDPDDFSMYACEACFETHLRGKVRSDAQVIDLKDSHE